jgi:hypothetical protein
MSSNLEIKMIMQKRENDRERNNALEKITDRLPRIVVHPRVDPDPCQEIEDAPRLDMEAEAILARIQKTGDSKWHEYTIFQKYSTSRVPDDEFVRSNSTFSRYGQCCFFNC